MGTLPQALPSAPPVPPEQQAQMGGGPPGGGVPGLASVANAQGGNVNPNDQLMQRANAIDAVLKQMAELNPAFAPFARQAQSAITNGLSAVAGGAQVSEGGLPPEMPTNAPPGAGMNPALG
jgi:hypothetical protein